MPIGAPIYTEEQRDAIASAWNDRRIRPAARVCELAAAGELTRPDGSKLDAFTVPEGTVRSLARHARKRRRGDLPSRLADAAPRDAVESLRRRLVAVADHELDRLERAQRVKPDEPINAEQLRQVSRAVLEVARLPGPTDPRPAPATTKDAEGRRAETRGGLAGPLLAAHRAGTLDAPRSNGTEADRAGRQDKNTHNREKGERSAATHARTEQQTHDTAAEPGVWARRQSEQLAERAEGRS